MKLQDISQRQKGKTVKFGTGLITRKVNYTSNAKRKTQAGLSVSPVPF